ncbi:hypothetical protein ACW2QC_06685 [Virgibacillus sp. FSP13]
MNGRQKDLLRVLLMNSEIFLHIDSLAEDLHCLEKTVRNDLNLIETFLRTYPSANLVRKPRVGLNLEIDEDERAQIFQSLFQTNSKSEEERIIKIAYRC